MSPLSRRLSRSRLTPWAIVALLLAIGAATFFVADRAQLVAPQPPPQAAGTYAPSDVITPSRSTTGSEGSPPAPSSASPTPLSQTPQGPILPASTPTRLRVPAIGVDEPLMKLGLNADHTVQVPPLSAHSVPGWYRYSPTPGQLGPSVILGHIDSAAYGPGVFFKLGALRKGDAVEVTRADHTIAVFRVDAVAQYPKDQFPSLTVYGNTDNAALRLITCGGTFDSSARSYEDNIVAFASLVSSHQA